MDSVKNKTEQGTQTRRGRPYSLGVRVLALLLGVMVFCLASASLAYYSVNSAPVRNLFIAAPEYELEYHDNTGSLANAGNMPSPNPQRNYTGRFTIPTAEPTREGYRFKGWSLTADGTGERLAGGTAYTASALHTDLYAQWEEAEYSLLFNANGGSNPPATLKAEALGDSHVFTVPEHSGMTPPKAGKLFQGWALTAEAETAQYAAGDSVTVTAAMANRSLTLYAVWATEYILHFDNNSEALSGYGDVPDTMRALSTAKSHTFVIPAQTADNTPQRDGVSGGLYEFGWWAADPDPDNYDAAQTVAYGSGYRVTEDAPEQTLYAFYSPRTPAKLVFYRNFDASDTTTLGSSAGTGTETLVPAQVTVANPSRSNYKFLGWAETRDATEAQYQRNDFVTINRIKENDKILYAVWQPLHRFSVNFISNGNTWNNSNDGIYRLKNGAWGVSSTGGQANVTASNGKSYIVYSDNRVATDLIADKSHTFTAADVWQQKGYYAVWEENPVGRHEFLGWSTDPNDDEPMYTVGDDNCLEQDIELSCTDPNCVGTDHQLVLFPVWKITPKHGYRLIFSSSYTGDTVVNSGTGVSDAHPSGVHGERPQNSSIYSLISRKGYEGYAITDTGDTKDIHASPLSRVSDGVNSWTWTKEELNADGPLASKAPAELLRYVLAGWSFERSGAYMHRLDIPVDENGKLKGDITIAHSAEYTENTAVTDAEGNLTIYIPMSHSDNAEGELHTLNLFPYWRTEALHSYAVIFGGADQAFREGETFYERYDEESGAWVQTRMSSAGSSANDISNINRSVAYYNIKISSGTLAETVTEDPWDAAFWASQRIRAVHPDTTTTRYKFLGWAYEPDQTTPDIPVDADGYLLAPVRKLREADCAHGACAGLTTGREHLVVLYPVWERSPLNTYKIVFDSGSGAAFLPWVKDANGSWTRAYNSARVTGTVVYPAELSKEPEIWNRFVPGYASLTYTAGPYVASEKRSYTWDQGFWDANGVSAGTWGVRDVVISGNTRYTFLGWSYEPGGTTQDDVDVEVDDGIIQGDITVTDPDGPETGGCYYSILYAVWKSETVHTYNLFFAGSHGAGGKGGVYHKQPGYYWGDGYGNYWNVLNLDGERYTFRGITFSSGEIVADGTAYTWDADFWDDYGVYAVHAPDGPTAYRFLGWAKDPDAPTPDYPVEWRTEDGEQRGYIADDVVFTEPNGSCTGGTHNLILFPVWQAVPNTRTYTLKFSGMGGSGAPADMSLIESSDGTAWPTDPPSFIIPTQKPSWGERLFVGWTQDSASATGTYGYVDNTDAKTEDATRHLQGSISYPYGTDGQKTLYAVWWNSYRLHYDGNAAGAVIAGVPADQYSYWSVGSHTYDVSGSIPTRENYVFKGWATAPNGAAQYGTTGTLNRQITLTANNGVADVTLYAVWEPASGTNSAAQPAAAQPMAALSLAPEQAEETPQEAQQPQEPASPEGSD